MNFESARVVELLTWQLRESEFVRSRDRSKIDSLANGHPPIPPDIAERDGIEVNSSDLSLTRLAHDARSQMYGAFFKPGSFFTARSDFGPVHKRQERGVLVTKEINRPLKRSL